MEKLKCTLEETHLVLHVRAGPEWFGAALRKARGLSAGLNKATTAWTGPENYEEDFFKIFSRRLAMTGEAFYAFPKEAIFRDLKARALLRGVHLSSSQDMDELSPAQMRNLMLPPSGCAHWAQHDAIRQSAIAGNPPIPGDSWFADLEQGRDGPSTPGPLLPSCLKHFTIWSYEKNRRLLGMEALQAHGWHLSEEYSHKFRSNLAPYFETLSEAHLQRLTGNGYALMVQSAWYLYVLSNTIKMDRRITFTRSLTWERKGASRSFDDESDERDSDMPDKFA